MTFVGLLPETFSINLSGASLEACALADLLLKDWSMELFSSKEFGECRFASGLDLLRWLTEN